MSKTPKVSAVICTYNRVNFLLQAIQSVLSQTFQDFEIVIVDDASRKETKKIVKSFKDKRIVYKRLSKNRGVPFARNLGTKIARGEYIAVMDDDDVCLPDRFENQVEILDKNKEVGAVYSRWYNFGKTDEIEYQKAGSATLENILFGSKIVLHPTIMIRKDWLKRVKYLTKFRYGSDYNLVARLIWKGCKFKLIRKPFLYHRCHQSSITHEHREEQAETASITRKMILDKIKIRKKFSGDMDKSWTISVISPLYNKRDVLDKFFEALRKQTYQNFEILFVDDGSSDNPFEVIRKHNKRFDIKYFWQPDKGYRLCTVRNVGMNLALGNIFCFIDPDIIVEKRYLEKVVKYLQADPDSLLLGVRDRVKDGKIISKEAREDLGNDNWKNMTGGIASILKHNAKRIGNFDEEYNGEWGFEDRDWGYRAYLKGIKIKLCSDLKTVHLEHPAFYDRRQNRNRKYFLEKFNLEYKDL